MNDLLPDELERLYLLQEECSEVIQAISKILRHGYESRNPEVPKSFTNKAELEKELGHLHLAIALLLRRNDLDATNIERNRRSKSASIKQWLHYN